MTTITHGNALVTRSDRPSTPGIVSWLAAVAERRKARHELEMLDDRMLADIGLARRGPRLTASSCYSCAFHG